MFLVDDGLGMGLRRDSEHVANRVHVGLSLPGNDGHDVNLVAIPFLNATRQDVVVALGGGVQGKLVPGILFGIWNHPKTHIFILEDYVGAKLAHHGSL